MTPLTTKSRPVICLIAFAALCAAPSARGGAAPAQKPLAVYNAQAVNLDGAPGAMTSQVQIQVTRWSSDEERDRVTTALVEKGEAALLALIQQLPSAGSLRTPQTVGHPLRYARRSASEAGGETVVIITDRPMSLSELRNAPPSRDYPFTVIRLRLNSKGQGQGDLMIATRIMADPATRDIAFENYTASVVQLQNVQRD